MVEVIVGSLFESNAQTLVNTVNCVGVMGKGIALEFKKRFPEMYKDYVNRCDHHEVMLGRPYLWRLTSPWVLNFPTKGDWRSVTKLSDIEEGLQFLVSHYKAWEITSLAVPPLGCGNGQLEWRIVGPTLYKYLAKLEVPVELYAPYGIPHEELRPDFLGQGQRQGAKGADMPRPEWIRTEWVIVTEILKRILDEPYHPPVGRTIFQKIAYVATEQGLTTGLDFKRQGYGPFTTGLKAMESRLLNNGLISVTKNGQMHQFAIGPTFEAARTAYRADMGKWENLIERTVDLFMRLDTTEAEIVASSMFVARELAESGSRPTERMVFDSVMDWKKRRRVPLDEEAVASTIRILAEREWLDVQPSPDLPLPRMERLFA